MKVKKNHIYIMKYGLENQMKCTVIVAQNDIANERYSKTFVIPYQDEKFKNDILQVNQDDLVEEVGKLSNQEDINKFKEHVIKVFGMEV